ncbi:chaperonin GroEL [Candidatus Pacearchaeota archaeon]|nr:chaperonin GroEL [Candidatus Pacearchaeota archaeon]|tara:strand:+ start:1969 stop:3558 length:1590 start_codon:yes stop_codon:yes gene_type:complete
MTQQSTVKRFQNGKKLQTQLLDGINKLADVVGSTLGPKGRSVLLHKKDINPVITKDGVTVAKFVSFEDPFENAGAQLLKQAASQTNAVAGDGTTTSTILARAILNTAQKYVSAGVSPIELKRGMDKALESIVEALRGISRPIESQEDIEHIATISANNDRSIGKLISMAVEQAGHDGSVSVEDGKSFETTLDLVEGFHFASGFFANAFITNQRRGSVEYDDPYVLVTDYKIDKVQDILPVLELMAREGKPLVIVAEEVEGQALAALIMNTVRGTMKVAAVKAPGYGLERREILSDLALSLGANFVNRESGRKLTDVKLTDFGQCKKVDALKYETTFVGGRADWEKVDELIEDLKGQIKNNDNIQDCERMQERITRLASGVAIIKVGAPTEVEMIEKKHRVEDALEAIRSAQEEGILPGGGIALVRAVENLEVEVENDDQRLGVEILKKAAYEPIRQLAINTGESADIIVNRVQNEAVDQNSGYDFKNSVIVDMIEAGIIDPAKVTRIALTNAVSVASTLLTTNHAIVEV